MSFLGVSPRADHPVTGASQYLVVGLKQWSRAHWPKTPTTYASWTAPDSRLHRIAQVEHYWTDLADFLAVLDDSEIGLMGVGYLHNATDLDVDDLWSYRKAVAAACSTRRIRKPRRSSSH